VNFCWASAVTFAVPVRLSGASLSVLEVDPKPASRTIEPTQA
jgi:hypothetical protein